MPPSFPGMHVICTVLDVSLQAVQFVTGSGRSENKKKLFFLVFGVFNLIYSNECFINF